MNNLFFCPFFNVTNIISSLALIVSILTLRVGYSAYKKFLVNQAQQRQLDIILDLIKQINIDKNNYTIFHPNNLELQIINPVSLFDIVNDNSFNTDDRLYFVTKGIMENRDDQILNWNFVSDFYRNPLLPKTIARKLHVFDISKNYPQETVDGLKTVGGIMLGNRTADEIERVSCFSFTPLEHAKTFQIAAKELKQTIIDWLKSYGITDINLMEE